MALLKADSVHVCRVCHRVEAGGYADDWLLVLPPNAHLWEEECPDHGGTEGYVEAPTKEEA
jgi:hypothetical protein